MKSRILQARKADGPLGIRTGLWLIVFGTLILCVFIVRLSPTGKGPTAVMTATSSVDGKRQDLPLTTARRTASKPFAPEVHQSGGARSDAGDQLLEMALSEIAQRIQDRHSWILCPQAW
jgi:hypothetical protein